MKKICNIHGNIQLYGATSKYPPIKLIFHTQVRRTYWTKQPIWRNYSTNSLFYYHILYHAKVYFIYVHVPTDLRQSDLVIDVIHAGRSRTCADVGTATASGDTRHVPCESQVAGDVVKIRRKGTTHKTLSLCDVQVFGSPRK